MSKPTYEQLAEALERLLAGSSNFGETVKPDQADWDEAFEVWKGTDVTPLYYHERDKAGS